MQSKSDDNMINRLDRISAQGVKSKSTKPTQKPGGGKVFLDRPDMSLPKDQAIEEATARMFKHLTGRDYKKPRA